MPAPSKRHALPVRRLGDDLSTGKLGNHVSGQSLAIFSAPSLRQRDFLHGQVLHIRMADIKIVDRHCVLNGVSGRFREANSPGLGHDQEGQDNGGYSRNGCRSHWSPPFPWIAMFAT